MNKPQNNHLHNSDRIKSNIKYTKYYLMLMTIVLLVIIGILALNFLESIEKNEKQEIQANLNTVLNATHNNIQQRFKELSNFAQQIQNDPKLVTLVKNNLALYRKNSEQLYDSSELKNLRQYFTNINYFKGQGFFIIAPDKISIASSRRENIGTINLIAKQEPNLLERVFSGKSLITPPIVSDVNLEYSNKLEIVKSPTMFAMTPIYDGNNVIAALAFRINTYNDFTNIAASGRYHPFSDIYIFNKTGELLNKTRHDEKIFSKKLSGDQTPIQLNQLNSKLMTHMAEKAIKVGAGFNLDGYTNLVGSDVFGQWLWNDTLSIGVAVEIEKEHALQTYYTTQKWVYGLYALTTLGVLFALYALMNSSNRAVKVLQDFNMELENNIRQKTQDLSLANISLQKAKENADHANNAKSVFLSNMSHELRTPLNAILGFSQMLKMDEQTPENHHEIIDEINDAGKLLLELINDILDLSKVELGKIPLNEDIVEISEILEKSITLITPLAAKKNIRIEYNCNCKLTSVVGDTRRMHQIFTNLLSNAVKYNYLGGTIKVQINNEEQNVVTRIQDSGFTIPQDKLTKIFEPFYRINMDDGKEEGTGIGLAITKQLVEQQKGNIFAQSVEKEGSTFTVTFPLHQVAENQNLNENLVELKDYKEKRENEKNKRTLLLIEDNKSNIKLIQHLFRDQPHLKLVTRETAEEGLQYLNEEHVDLVLMDINLPGINGYQALEAIKSSEKINQIPVIAVTSNAMKEDFERGLKAGFTDYICKPVDINNFLNRVNENLN